MDNSAPALLSSSSKPHTVVSSTMSASEVIQILVEHDCRDITPELDLARCTHAPVSCGGFGDVFKGALKSQIEVAIKCPRLYIQQDDEAGKVLKHAARELYTWSHFRHENVLKLLGLAEYQDRIAMIAPWMANGTLLEHLRRNPEADRYQLLVQTSRGVAYLHECDAIHGDLKSANILVSESGVAKISDFGFTTLKSQALRFTTSTMNPAISARWTAPEVLKGEVPRSKEADVYSLGMVFLEVVSGCAPFNDIVQDMTVLFAVCSGRTPSRPVDFVSFDDLQAELLWNLFQCTWIHEPAGRPDLRKIQDCLNTIKKHSYEEGGKKQERRRADTNENKTLNQEEEATIEDEGVPEVIAKFGPDLHEGEAQLPRNISSSATRAKAASRTQHKKGCITCRVRQKKCAGLASGSEDCTDCIRLNIQCLGFHPKRPDWLKNVEALKELKYRIKHRRTEYPAPRGGGLAPQRSFLEFSDLVDKYSPRSPTGMMAGFRTISPDSSGPCTPPEEEALHSAAQTGTDPLDPYPPSMSYTFIHA